MRDVDYYRTSLKKHATIASISRHASILDADITGNRNELGIGLEKSNSKRVFSRSSTRLKKAASFRHGSGKTPRKVSDKTPSLKKPNQLNSVSSTSKLDRFRLSQHDGMSTINTFVDNRHHRSDSNKTIIREDVERYNSPPSRKHDSTASGQCEQESISITDEADGWEDAEDAVRSIYAARGDETMPLMMDEFELDDDAVVEYLDTSQVDSLY